MPYSRELYEEADRILDQRRQKSQRVYDQKKQELKEKYPLLAEIEKNIWSLRFQVVKNGFENSSKLEQEIAKAEKERDEFKSKNNINDADYEQKYKCDLCKDRGVYGVKMCDCKKKIVQELAAKKADSSSSFWANFDDFNLDLYPNDVGKGGKSKRQIADLILRAAKKFNEGNVFIHGAVGVGKTFLTECIANKWLHEGKIVCYYSATRLFLMLNDQYFNKDKKADLSDKVNLLYEADLLIIDDLGTEFRNSFTESMFFDILNDRMKNKKSTIISTNLNQDELANIYSDRISSRIRGNFQTWELLGDDIRQKKLRSK